MKLLRTHSERAGWSAAQFARATASESGGPPIVDFVAEDERCPHCGSEQLKSYKTRLRKVITLSQGALLAREVLKECAQGTSCPPMRSQALKRVVAPRQRFGYDLMVHVGLARYLRQKQRQEICAELFEQRHIVLCEASVSVLCDRFLIYLEALHLYRAPQLRAAMGPYPLHIDATCERGRGGLLASMNGWRNWVLLAARIPTESGDHVRPLVDKTVSIFGDPIATLRDMRDAGAHAVKPLRKRNIPDLICHYHFLGAVGKKLLEQSYSLLRTLLRASAVQGDLRALLRDLRRYRQSEKSEGRFGSGHVREDLLALVLWLLEAEGRKQLAFPFALPLADFARRIRNATHKAESWIPRPRTEPERRAIQHLGRLAARLERDRRVDETLRSLDERWPIFCQLRDILRLTNAELSREDVQDRPIEIPALELLRLREVEEALDRYRKDLCQRTAGMPKRDVKSSSHGIVLAYLDRYGDHLFGHPALHDEDGNILAVVARTNIPLEKKWGEGKRQLRRRVATAHLARSLEEQPAQVALTLNLRCPDYVQALCGSVENMPAAFADLSVDAIAQATPLERDHRDSALQRRVRSLARLDDETSEQQVSVAGTGKPPPTTGDAPRPADLAQHQEGTATAALGREHKQDPLAPVPCSKAAATAPSAATPD